MRPRVGVVRGVRGHVGRPVLPAGLVRGLELRRALIDSAATGSGMRPALSGSGKLGTPWLRTHRANPSPCALPAAPGRRSARCRRSGAGDCRPLGRLEPGTADAELLQASASTCRTLRCCSGRASSAPRASACSGRRRPLRWRRSCSAPRASRRTPPPEAASPVAAMTTAAVATRTLMADRALSAPASRRQSPPPGSEASSGRLPEASFCGPRRVGSAKLGNPCARRHSATFTPKASFCCRSCGVAVPPLDSRCLQVSFAALDVCFDTPVRNGGKSPCASGSGKFGTPCERMQCENASASVRCDGVAEVVVAGEPPHADASSTSPDAATNAAATLTSSMIARRDNSHGTRR